MRENHRDKAVLQLYESKFLLCKLNYSDIVEGERAITLSPREILTSTTTLLQAKIL